MRLVVEPRNAVIGLRLKIGTDDSMLSFGGEEWKPPPSREIAHQCRYKDRLAGARQSRHAKPHRRRQEIAEARLCVLDQIVGKVSQEIARLDDGSGVTP